ncbi:histidyl-tRNA synthetase [Ligilactobacillus salitolerans]|uniref:Histidine--tRNA ligase n=1 Tax=Ligilactobacillus salitolerans TaxID=1808352 RepID=A0A401IU28_9LACO|nr:histidine--tRNA ligase [Ligilactobacillus salitolerans]GBG95008.1 histidyl-tRNA synthetase [Ligilactobacillus salitolerans]
MKYQRPKGTADILPEEAQKWAMVESKARSVFAKYRYQEMRTPMFESFDVFSRTSGETSDIVTKEMYDFYDKGDRHITLRPEGTAGIVRAYVENKLYGPEIQKPFKTFYMGPMFRYERPQSGRLRQFHQIGVEAFGSDSPALDVEVIALAMSLLQSVGLNSLKLSLNTLGDDESRKNYRQALIDFLEPHEAELSQDSKERLHKNPLRVLDSKDSQDQAIVADAPSILDYLTPAAQKHFDEVQDYLKALNISYEIDSNMVRGLDYYNHTIFEVMSDSKAFGGKWTTVCAGGRYNGLVEQLGGPETSGVGFGLGIERLLLILDAEKINLVENQNLDVYVVGIGSQASPKALQLVEGLRKQGFSADRDYLDKKPKGQFKAANKANAQYTLTLGEEELAQGKVNLKDMSSGQQVSVSFEQVLSDFSQVKMALLQGEGEKN